MSTVETSSTLYAMDSLTHELTPSLEAKVALNAPYQSIDSNAPITTTSPRISSTPPSTPGLDSMQSKGILEEEDELDDRPDGNNDDDDDDDDDYDYGYNDYDNYLNEDYSEPDEDYFYKDFAETDTMENTTTAAPRRPKSKRFSRRHRSQKAMSRFDLQSFARQLHENRLSVLQTRQSRMILTEEDEQELDKLLARKYSHDNAPPVPSLPPLPSENTAKLSSAAAAAAATAATTTSKPVLTTPVTMPDTELIARDKNTVATTALMDDDDGASTELAGPIPRLSISSDLTKKNSILLQKLNNQDLSIKTSKNGSLDQVTVPVSPSLSDPSSLASPKQPVFVSPSKSSSSISSNTSTSKNDKEQLKAAPASPLGTSTSTTVKKKPSWIASHLKQSTTKTKHQLSDTTAPPKAPRRSMSVDTLRDSARQNDSWKSTAAPKAISTASPAPSVDQTRKPKLRLFGSLRQASRSSRASGEGAFRGLMRNLSTVGQRQQQQQQQKPVEQDVTPPSDNSRNAASTMSQAAMAVIHHDESVKKEKLANKKEAATATTTPSPELSTKIEVDMMDGVDDTTEQVTHTATSTKGGVRLLTNLLAKARSARRSQKKPSTQQQDNDNNDDAAIPKERNKVIRRTIIYVQPDALDFMKDGHLPPIPAPKHRLPKNTNSTSSNTSSDNNDNTDDVRFSNDTMMDDDASTTVEYATATKLTRQASRRKRLVENPIAAPTKTITSATTASRSDKKWRLESVSQLNLDKPTTKEDDDDGQLEGLELREMSDGSVVWGIVKKQGNRKSFFASKTPMDDLTKSYQLPQQQQHEQQDDDDIEKSVLALMGLGPDSLDRFSQQQQQQQRAGTGGVTPRKSKKAPPPIPKRSPRRLTEQHDNQSAMGDQQQQQHPGDAAPRRSERGLSVEEQLDEMMLTIKQAQF